MDSKLSRWCEGAIEAGWIAAIIVTPLFFNIHSARVFEPDKLTLLRTIALIMSAAWLVKFVDQQGWRTLSWLKWRSENSIWRMPFVLPMFMLVAVYIVSTIFSITPIVSLLGSYQRLQGTYTTLAFIVVFALMAATIRSRQQISRVVTTIIITSIPIALYGMLQHYGLDPLPWGGNVQIRIAGHMGNSIFLSAYLIMVVPLTLARIIDAFTNILGDEEPATADVIRSSIYIFALSIQLIAIIWTQSRGPLVGLAVGIYAFVLIFLVSLRNIGVEERRFSWIDAGRAIFLVVIGTILPFVLAVTLLSRGASALGTFLFFLGAVGLLTMVILILALARRGWSWLWLSWLVLAVVMAGILGLFNISVAEADSLADTPIAGGTMNTLAEWKKLPEIGRFGRLLESESGTGKVRVLIWEGVLDLIGLHEPLQSPQGEEDSFNRLRPLFGYGPESMYVAYNRFYPPELATVEARNASPDRSHNETFDALAITGAAGFLAWQLLYLSVFYYSFKWLGVVRSKIDRNIFFIFWIAGAVLGGILLTRQLGLPFLGVAIPFGTIAGLVLYLIYYALVSRGRDRSADVDPFSADRLLMIGLISAILAHYVEIHFGIAIASTRTHFFVYVALLFGIGYCLPRVIEQKNLEGKVQVKGPKRKRGRSADISDRGWLSSILSSSMILGLIIGILGYNYVSFSLPPGETIQSIEDVPSSGDIVQQSFFVNPAEGFLESPFIFMLIMLSWILGVLLMLSELMKEGKIVVPISSSNFPPGRRRRSAIVFAIMLVFALSSRFILTRESTIGLNRLVGEGLLLIWAALCLFAAFRLIRRDKSAQLTGGIIALIGLSLALPVIIAGSVTHGLVMALGGILVLTMLWDRSWNQLVLPAGILAVTSFAVGFTYIFLQAIFTRAGILPPPGATDLTTLAERRVLEAAQSIDLLSAFYIFLVLVLIALAYFLSFPKFTKGRTTGSLGGFVSLVILIPVLAFAISETNLKVIQADIIFKRADPWDKEAGRTGDPETWDNAIAIYEYAIDSAPNEDFYYLWLGRAYLERSAVTEDENEQIDLLKTAEQLLKEAQDLNPYNTDHTANLARLNTRWAELSKDETRLSKVNSASTYYESAMVLSPQNAVIANEYARLLYLLRDDCDRAIKLYDLSAAVDPYYIATLFDAAEIAKLCGDQSQGEKQGDFYQMAAVRLAEALKERPDDARRWLQLAEIQVKVEDVEAAESAYMEAVARQDENIQEWQISLAMAQWWLIGQMYDQAELYGELALNAAPADALASVQQLMDQIASQRKVSG